MALLDNIKSSNRFKIIRNEIEMIIKQYASINPDKYNDISDTSDLIKYSKGGLKNIHGVYSFDKLNELVATNFEKGKFIKNNHIFDFRYSYKDGLLRMIEKYSSNAPYLIFFLHYFENKVYVIGYRPNFKENKLNLAYITISYLNTDNILIESVQASIISNNLISTTYHKYFKNNGSIIEEDETTIMGDIVVRKGEYICIRDVDMNLLRGLKI